MVDVYIVGTRTEEHVAERDKLNNRYIGYLDIYGQAQPVEDAKIKPPSWWRGGTGTAQAEMMAKMLRRRRK